MHLIVLKASMNTGRRVQLHGRLTTKVTRVRDYVFHFEPTLHARRVDRLDTHHGLLAGGNGVLNFNELEAPFLVPTLVGPEAPP